MPGYNSPSRGTACTLSKFLCCSKFLFCSIYCLFCVVLCIVRFVSFCVLFACKCVLYNCHRAATQLQLTNISTYHIIPQDPQERTKYHIELSQLYRCRKDVPAFPDVRISAVHWIFTNYLHTQQKINAWCQCRPYFTSTYSAPLGIGLLAMNCETNLPIDFQTRLNLHTPNILASFFLKKTAQHANSHGLHRSDLIQHTAQPIKLAPNHRLIPSIPRSTFISLFFS
jgi:hypothetical protein